MGYTTDFYGTFKTSRPLTNDEQNILQCFNETRHGGNTFLYKGMPGLYCGWVATDTEHIGWDGVEKFYNYTAWLKFLITYFFKPRGIELSGEVRFYGEDENDTGTITINGYICQTTYDVDIQLSGDTVRDVTWSEHCKWNKPTDDEKDAAEQHLHKWQELLGGKA